ncbi:hypothetical protein AGMMS50293_12460 [Spirochaetia bacterium]|nr:hypothetical protein AGMMS50293_12460 [Spirochaetia bacterium]
MNLSIDASGNISVTFPYEARDFATKTKALAIPAAQVQAVYAALPVGFTFHKPGISSPAAAEMRDADRDAIIQYLKAQIAGAIDFVRETLHDGVVQPNLTAITGHPAAGDITGGAITHPELSNPTGDYTDPPTVTNTPQRTVYSGILNNTVTTNLADAASLTVAGTSMNLSIDASGDISVDFPLDARDFSGKSKVLSVSRDQIQAVYEADSTALNFRATGDSTEMTEADENAVVSYLRSEIVKAVRVYTDTHYSDGSVLTDTVGAQPAADTIHFVPHRGSLTDPGSAYTPPPVPPTIVTDKTVWGNAATLTIPSTGTITLDVTMGGNYGQNAAPATDDIAALVDNITMGTDRAVVVTFTNGGNPANDKVRFNVITALYTALAARTSGTITMRPAAGANAVAPLFNGDDMFGFPGSPFNSMPAYDMAGKVFNEYTNGQEIFEGFTVRQESGRWYIDKTDGKSLIVSRLKWFRAEDMMGYTKGFGLQARALDCDFTTASITGQVEYSPGNYIPPNITPEHLETGLALLGLSYPASDQLFTIDNLKLVNAYSGSSPNNLYGTQTLAFLEKYMGSTTDLAKLAGLSFSNYLRVEGDNPFIENTYSTVETLNGNLAVYLGNKGVYLYDLVLGDPSLYTPIFVTSIGVPAENLVLQGDGWKNIQILSAQGVIVSQDTPLKAITGENVWYVVCGNVSRPTSIGLLSTGILEVRDSSGTIGTYTWLNSTSSGTLKARITYSAAQTTALISEFGTSISYPTGGMPGAVPGAAPEDGSRPTTTWQQWADEPGTFVP